jgi:hypothetical protein
MAETYKIYVGDTRGSDAMLGYLQPDGMNSVIKGSTQPAQQFGGFSIFANRSQCWGRRILEEGKVPEKRVEPTDEKYEGKIEWMKWNAPGGYPITVRYKNTCASIDYDYQVIQLDMPKFENDLEDNYMQLPFGENTLYFDSEQAKIDFLRIHHENEDSIYKSPNSTGGQFRDVKLFDTQKQDVKAMDEWFEAIKIIKDANSYEKLKVLKIILGKKLIKEDESNENSLYENLMLYAKEDSKGFMDALNTYKRKVSDIFEKAKSYKAIDTTKHGVIVIGQEKREEMFTNIPAKGEAMIDWVFKNSLEPEMFEAIDKLGHISNKFK